MIEILDIYILPKTFPFGFDAYASCNMELISTIDPEFESRVNNPKELENIYSQLIAHGYYNGTDPCLVYDMISLIQKDEFYPIPPNIDIWQMVLTIWDSYETNKSPVRKKELFERLLRLLSGQNKLGDKEIYSDWGNLELLNFILIRFVSIRGARGIMKKIKFNREYPLSQQIYTAYQKIAKQALKLFESCSNNF